MRHVISILLENETGALSRVAGLFSARGYNIKSLTVAPTDDSSLSRMTLVTHGEPQIIEQIIKQLNKLIDVVKVMDLPQSSCIVREMLLVKIASSSIDDCALIKRISDIFRARIIDVKQRTYTIELTGRSDKLDSFIEALECQTILEVVRSGAMGIARGNIALHL
jgi:acetolactate synthase-1/3 small subunit